MVNGIRNFLIITLSFIFLSACHRQVPLESLYRDARLKFTQGDFRSALATTELGLARSASGPNERIWQFRLLKAEILIWQGFSHDAVNLLTASESTIPHEFAARREVLLGLAHSNLQQMDIAQEELSQAQVLNHPEVPSTTCALLLGQGKLAAIRGDFSQSEEDFRKAREVASAEHDALLEANALGSLGMLQMRQRHFADAVDWLNISLSVSQPLKAEASTIRTMGNLGWAYLEMGDLERAAENFSRAEVLSEKNGMVADDQTWLMNIGAVQFLQRKLKEAESTYQKSLRLARSLEDRQETIYGLNGLAKIAITDGRFQPAQKYDAEAFELENAIGDHEGRLYSLLNEAKIAFATGQLTTAKEDFERVATTAQNNGLKAEALSSWARLEEKQNNIDDAEHLFQQAITVLDNARRALGRPEFELSYPTNAQDAYDEYIEFLMSNGRQEEAFDVVETHRAMTLVEGLSRKPFGTQMFTPKMAMKIAGEHKAIILSYWLGRKNSYVWYIGQNHFEVFTLPNEDVIHNLAIGYRSKILSSLGGYTVNSGVGQDLYNILIRPVEKLILQDANVVIVPDGDLCGLNFETLVSPSPKPHYWIEDVAITEANSIIVLGQRREPARLNNQSAHTLLVIGDPQSPANYSPLIHAHEEVDAVKRHFEPSRETVLTGSAATPTSYFRANPREFSIVHFVAHGTASRISPLDSAVVLSDDGKSYNLSARQIISSSLQAKLVTISACDSAGDRIYSSEGLVGLSWAFLRAGAHQVVSALWEVNDASTPRLMDRFYEGVSHDEDPALALRMAKLEMLHTGGVYQKPFYWAPFVLYEGH